MRDEPLYRWEIRRAAKDRKEKHAGAISTHDLVMLAVIMAMLVIVLRIIMIYGTVLGMEIGPFTPTSSLREWKSLPYANVKSVTESFNELKFISFALFIYWVTASWRCFASSSVSFSTKLFKAILGVTILVLCATSFFPDNALYLAEVWFDPPFRPQHISTPIAPNMNAI